jgi:hypothetical protein
MTLTPDPNVHGPVDAVIDISEFVQVLSTAVTVELLDNDPV